MSFTHLDESGHARMVDVTGKQPTVRAASARAFVTMAPDTVAALRDGSVPKGDVLAVSRIAGIQAAKRTPELLPLAHVIGVHGVVVDQCCYMQHLYGCSHSYDFLAIVGMKPGCK